MATNTVVATATAGASTVTVTTTATPASTIVTDGPTPRRSSPILFIIVIIIVVLAGIGLGVCTCMFCRRRRRRRRARDAAAAGHRGFIEHDAALPMTTTTTAGPNMPLTSGRGDADGSLPPTTREMANPPVQTSVPVVESGALHDAQTFSRNAGQQRQQNQPEPLPVNTANKSGAYATTTRFA